MKQLFSLFILLQVFALQAQDDCYNYCLGFEDTMCISHLVIDTSSNNLWQIGIPDKNIITGGYASETAIVTDTMNPYSVNNHSVFTIWNIATEGDIYGFKTFLGSYVVQTDSIKDYGLIEFSPDNGVTWIDLVHDTLYSTSIHWYSNVPVFTGRSSGWKHFEVLLADNSSVFGVELGDTLLYRFSFFSDDTFDDMDGIAFDQICFYEFVEGISETRFTPIKSKLFPNPTRESFTIEFDNPDHGSFELAVYNIKAELVFTIDPITVGRIHLNAGRLQPGMYVYKLTNLEEKERSWGKFIIAE